MGMQSAENTLGIDFGTSNSAAAILVSGKPFLIEVEPGHKTVPTSVFFDFSSRDTLFGNAANNALIQGLDGRFMRSLKSVLGTPLMHEKRQFMDERLSFVEIIGRFLARIRMESERTCHRTFEFAVSGRPVHFHSDDAAKDRQALDDLRQCYDLAGFCDVRFVYEPEAAALANGAHGKEGSIGMIVDIGGGTSDFTLFRNGDTTGRTAPEFIASHGVRVGGTNFDKSISVDHVMPLFGRGAEIRRDMGPGTLRAPNAIFQDLATWEKIPFLYSAATRRDATALRQLAVAKQPFERLVGILEQELGHDVAFAVEAGKIRANKTSHDGSRIDLGIVEPGLSAGLTKRAMAETLAGHIDRIRDCANETLALAGCPAEQVDSVIFVGGSGLMAVVEHAMVQVFPKAVLHRADAFTAVVDGLAIAANQPFKELRQ